MADISVGWVLPLPRNTVGRRIEDWFTGVIEATRATLRSRPRPGEPQRYHHPRRETLEKLQDEGAHTWRTDLLGVFTFYIDGTGAHPASLP